MDWTSEEHRVAQEFKRIAWEEVIKYVSMTDEEVLEEYRLAGKLHKYNPFSEMQKRFAKVAKMYPPPDGYFPWVEEEFFRFIDDDEELESALDGQKRGSLGSLTIIDDAED